MTHPITEPTQSIRERSARAAYDVWSGMVEFQDVSPAIQERYYEVVDAIVAELQEPSLDLLFAMAEVPSGKLPRSNETRWKSAIEHIRSGGK